MQSTQGGGGRSSHIWCWNSCCLQRCWICTGRILHQTLVPYQIMCILLYCGFTVDLNRSVAIDVTDNENRPGTIYLNRHNDKNLWKNILQLVISIPQNTLSSNGDNGSYKYFVFEAGFFSRLNLFDKIFYITINNARKSTSPHQTSVKLF